MLTYTFSMLQGEMNGARDSGTVVPRGSQSVNQSLSTASGSVMMLKSDH